MTGFVETTIAGVIGGPTVSRASTKMVGSNKVYEVDASVGCFVFDALTPDECDALIRIAEDHVERAESGEIRGTKGWRKVRV